MNHSQILKENKGINNAKDEDGILYTDEI